MKKNIIKRVGLLLILLVMTVVISGCLRPTPPVRVDRLEVWGVWDDSDVMDKLLSSYKDKHTYIQEIKYRKLTYDEYEKELINALATGKGPDIFIAHHTWLAKHRDLMISMEESQQVYNGVVDAMGGCSKPPRMEEPLISLRQYNEAFVDVAYNDFTKDGKIYGIPLAVDTLALYYNKDLFNAAGIAYPPETWEELEQDVRVLTRKDEFNNIEQAGIAMGTADNVNRAGDILALMMLQRGTPIVSTADFTPKLNTRKQVEGSTEYMFPAYEAIKYYTSFSDAGSPNYTWNHQMHQSIDLFQEGRAAMMINYTYAIETIKTKAPKLSFGVARIPQIEGVTEQGKMTYANYWGYVVSRKALEKKNKPIEAWKLLRYLGEKEQIKQYSTITKRPASRRDVINEQKNEPDIGTFADQALIAKSWFQPDETRVDKIFNENIEQVATGALGVKDKGYTQAVENMDAGLKVLLDEYKYKNKL